MFKTGSDIESGQSAADEGGDEESSTLSSGEPDTGSDISNGADRKAVEATPAAAGIGQVDGGVLAQATEPNSANDAAMVTDGGQAAAASQGQVVIQHPVGLTPRQLRGWLRAEVDKALDNGDLVRVRALNKLLTELDMRGDHRAHRDGLLRKANRENPYDARLRELYADWTVLMILQKFMKAIRFDFSKYGLVGGLAMLLLVASESVGKPVDLDVLKAQTKAVAWKLKERIYGLGYEFTTDANQILRIVAELLGQGPVPQDQWLKKQPLPGPRQWDAEFDADWNDWLATRAATSEAL